MIPSVGTNTLKSIHKNVCTFCVQILYNIEQGGRHADAVQVVPKGLPWDRVITYDS